MGQTKLYAHCGFWSHPSVYLWGILVVVFPGLRGAFIRFDFRSISFSPSPPVKRTQSRANAVAALNSQLDRLRKRLNDDEDESMDTSGTVAALKRAIDEFERAETDSVESLRSELNDLKARVGSSSGGGGGGGSPWPESERMMYDLTMPSPPAIRGHFDAAVDKLGSAEKRGIYGGEGDPDHLGGFTANDTMGQSPALWTYMIKYINTRSLVDVGCGRGISTKFFLERNVDVLCVEGSHDAIKKSLIPLDKIVEHDFSQGPWWPSKTYDVAWSVEFLEHVGRQYARNYLPIFHRSALMFVTYSNWGGWHHVEVHPLMKLKNKARIDNHYWVNRMKAQGFVHLEKYTEYMRRASKLSQPEGFNGQHLWLTMMVFLNPRIASMEAHEHMFGGPSCWSSKGQKPCEGVDALPAKFDPVWNEPTKYDEVFRQWENGNQAFELKDVDAGGKRRRRLLRHRTDPREEETEATMRLYVEARDEVRRVLAERKNA